MKLPSGNTINSPYEGTGYSTAYNTLYQQLQGLHSDSSQAEQQVAQRLDQAGNEFSNLFQNSVGRAPTQSELDKFFSENAGSTIANSASGTGRSENDPVSVQNAFNNYIGSTFQQTAKDYATQQLQNQQTQANSLADQYRTLGKQSLDSTSQYLQNYDQQLFNRLQPQIMQSLQSQGLLNTGGLNEAMAGAQKDLAANAQGYLADANLQMQNQANAIQFGGASAPYQYQQSQIMNQVPYMQQQAGIAGTNSYNTYMQQLQYQDQLGLQNNAGQIQAGLQPSFMRTLGQSFGNSLGQSAGQWFSPGAGMNQQGTSGNYANAAKLLG